MAALAALWAAGWMAALPPVGGSERERSEREARVALWGDVGGASAKRERSAWVGRARSASEARAERAE